MIFSQNNNDIDNSENRIDQDEIIDNTIKKYTLTPGDKIFYKTDDCNIISCHLLTNLNLEKNLKIEDDDVLCLGFRMFCMKMDLRLVPINLNINKTYHNVELGTSIVMG